MKILFFLLLLNQLYFENLKNNIFDFLSLSDRIQLVVACKKLFYHKIIIFKDQ